ncbi:MAG TPA: DegT/DnrJ/EryC1/StrS family aminotransferase [Candidatus Sulfotelmatobacter sp.]|nr:DegT/DnrJ/EryC1/StrS family aminotransferase [Candidatus Sulfotelmatobacter sp.]
MLDKFIAFHKPSIGPEEFAAISRVLESGWLTTGPVAQQFERDFEAYIGCRYALAVNSCTAALQLGLDVIELEPHDEVLVPTYTFTASAAVVAHAGARPVLCDSAPGGFNVDPADLESRISSKTRAIMAVHIGGDPCDLIVIRQIAARHGLHLIEDAAHALPASHCEERIGCNSEIGAFSFYATKTITAGEGGMFVTSNEVYAQRAKLMRLHGISGDAWKRYSKEGTWHYDVMEAGFKMNMPDLLAAIGLAQLSKADWFYQRRREIALRYLSLLSTVDELEMPGSSNGHSWHLFIVRLRPALLGKSRQEFIEDLKHAGIGTSVHFIPLHLHSFYRERYGYREGDFPNAESAYERAISLPIYPGMSDSDVEYVANTIKRIVQASRAPVYVSGM